MIKKNEVRIGNKIYCLDLDVSNGKWIQKVIDVGYRDIYNLSGTNDIVKSYYEPIPLTEEWLVRFMFEKSGVNWYFNHILSIELCENFIQIDLGYTTISVDCEYVHQLQNLYFALTGEELELTQ